MVKVERNLPAPDSLAIEAKKANGSYREKDVIDSLRIVFHDKCYICELKGLQDPEVEHLLPHKGGKYPERKYDWNNLFWSCGHCNRVKNKEIYDVGIIDCCRQDPEALLRLYLIEDDVYVEAFDKNDEKVVLTANLIEETFNLRNTGIREAECDYRIKALMESMNIFYRELEKYMDDPDSNKNKRMMQSLLSRESAFAAFKRGFIREREDDYPGLVQYIT